MWLLSERAVRVLMERCGWNADTAGSPAARAARYELYCRVRPRAGQNPDRRTIAAVNALTCAVVPLPEAEFYHFGTSGQMIESVAALQNLVLDETKLGLHRRAPAARPGDAELALRRRPAPRTSNHTLWVENSVVPAGWQLASQHVLTGVPENDWTLRLEPGVCLDFVPVGEDRVLRAGLRLQRHLPRPAGRGRDPLAGPAGAATGSPRAASSPPTAASIRSRTSSMPPCSRSSTAGGLDPAFVEWLCAAAPAPGSRASPAAGANCRGSRRSRSPSRSTCAASTSSARGCGSGCLLPMLQELPLERLLPARPGIHRRAPSPPAPASSSPSCAFDDARRPDAAGPRPDVPLRRPAPSPRAGLGRQFEAGAFARLREMIVHEAQLSPCVARAATSSRTRSSGRAAPSGSTWPAAGPTPRPTASSTAARCSTSPSTSTASRPSRSSPSSPPDPELVMRSIDLGVEERVRTYAELDTFGRPGQRVRAGQGRLRARRLPARASTPTAASPRWSSSSREFGGGIELSLLAAVPKGSGLGTSSILAATVLAALGDLCGLDWDRNVLFTRTLALEQMLTTGGGWQDQAGAIFRGIKLIETAPGLAQKPAIALAAASPLRPRIRQPLHPALLHRHHAPGQEHPRRNRARHLPQLPVAPGDHRRDRRQRRVRRRRHSDSAITRCCSTPSATVGT